nr:RecName: Full=Medusin-TR1; Short=MDS-TR1; AltName: Full=Phylloseptin-4TR; Short=PLS-4TR [Phyllomedusa trinitatis]
LLGMIPVAITAISALSKL